MNSRFLPALGMAVLLGAGAMAAASALAPAAQAATVRPAVGKPLQEAIALAKAGKGGAAMAQVKKAEAVSGLTGSERSAIDQTRKYIAAKTGAGTGAVGCKARFASDYNAGRYHQVVGADAECLRKSGGLDRDSQVIVAQAYYLMGDYGQAIKLLRGLGSSENVLSLLMSAASKSGDVQTQGKVAERLILNGQTKDWTYLLTAAGSTHALTDPDDLNIYRIRMLTGNMRNAEDYEVYTELALELHFPTEALNVAQKGFDAKLLQGERDTRLLNLAKTQAAKDSANLATAQKKARASKDGADLAQYGENLWGYGKYADAVNAIKAGIAKGVAHKDEAQIALGIAQLSAGHKDAAVKTFAGVKGRPGAEAVARLWSVYARAGGTATGTTATKSAPAKSASAKPASGTSKKRHRH